MTRVVVTGRDAERGLGDLLRAAGLDVLEVQHPTDADLARADCLTGFRWPEGATQRVGWIHVTGLGIDRMSDAPRPDLMTRTVGTMPLQMGRYVAAAVASFAERHDGLARAQAAEEWLDLGVREWPTSALVLGTGVAAQGVAPALRGLGLGVVGVNRSGRAAPDFDRCVGWADLADVAEERPGVVVNLLPLTDATRDTVGGALFRRLDGALFVNPGRGATVDEAALRAALASGTVTKAWLDVHRVEPLPPGHWAWSHPGVRVTPHLAAITRAEDAAADLLAALAALERGETPPTAVDPSAY